MQHAEDIEVQDPNARPRGIESDVQIFFSDDSPLSLQGSFLVAIVCDDNMRNSSLVDK